MEAHDVIGVVGVALIVGSYLLLQIGQLEGRGAAYSALNAVGAALVLLSLSVDFNLSAFIIEMFWLAISLMGLALAWRRQAT